MGILRDIRNWWTLKQAENILERQLQENWCYPFQERIGTDGSFLYLYSSRIPYLYFGLVGVVFSCLSFLVYGLIGGEQDYYVYNLCVLCASVYMIIKYRKRWSLVLEPSKGIYCIYHGHKLAVTGLYHNIYVRMLIRQTGLAQSLNYLVIDGWGFSVPLTVSKLTKNNKKLRQLALKLAQPLSLNYFDVADYSTRHVIKTTRPKCQYIGSDDSDEEQRDRKLSKDTSQTLSSLASQIRASVSRDTLLHLEHAHGLHEV